MNTITKFIKLIEDEFPELLRQEKYNNKYFDWEFIKYTVKNDYQRDVESAYEDGVTAIKDSITNDTSYKEATDYFKQKHK